MWHGVDESTLETHFLFQKKKKKSNNHSILLLLFIFQNCREKTKILTTTSFMSDPPQILTSLCNRNSKHTHTKQKDASVQAFTSHSTSAQNLNFHSKKP